MPPLVEIIQLKWLLAGKGVHLHVERLLSDPVYAQQALQHAEACDNATVREVARRMRGQLPTAVAE
jgi:hypothetical protein